MAEVRDVQPKLKNLKQTQSTVTQETSTQGCKLILTMIS